MKIENLNDYVVFDPFCGSGNILMEALLLGCDIVGSDISEKAVEDTRANLEWLNNELRIMNNGENDKDLKNHNSSFVIHNSVFKADATSYDFNSKLSTFDFELSIRDVVVVTEPYLGKPKQFKPSKSTIEAEICGLRDLYINFFKNLATIIHNSSFFIHSLCFVFPLIETMDGGTVSLYDECVDELRQIGYNPIQTFIYGRDYQVTKRQIAIFKLQETSDKKQTNLK